MVCRLCEVESNLIDLFSEDSSPTILLYIHNLTSVEIKENDVASKQICKNCLQNILNMTLFRMKAIITDRKLQGNSGKEFDDFPQELLNNTTNSKLIEMRNKLIVAKRNVLTQTLTQANVLTEKISNEVRITSSTATDTNLDDHVENESVTTSVPDKQNSKLKHESIRLLQNLYPNLIIPSNLDKFNMLPIVKIEIEDLNKRRREIQRLHNTVRLKRRLYEAEVSKANKVARIEVPEKEEVREGAKQETFVSSLGLLPGKRPDHIIPPTQYPLTAISSTEHTLAIIPPTEPTLSTISPTAMENRITSLDSSTITSRESCVPSSLPLKLITPKNSVNEVESLLQVKTAYTVHICHICQKAFSKKRLLTCHLLKHPTCPLCDKTFENKNIYTKHITNCPKICKNLHVKLIKLDDDKDVREMYPDIIKRKSKPEISPKIIQFEDYIEEIITEAIVKKNLSISIHSDEEVIELQSDEDDNVVPQIEKNNETSLPLEDKDSSNDNALILVNSPESSSSTHKNTNNNQVDNYNYSNIEPIHLVAPKPNREITLKEVIAAARRKTSIIPTIKPMRVKLQNEDGDNLEPKIEKNDETSLPLENSGSRNDDDVILINSPEGQTRHDDIPPIKLQVEQKNEDITDICLEDNAAEYEGDEKDFLLKYFKRTQQDASTFVTLFDLIKAPISKESKIIFEGACKDLQTYNEIPVNFIPGRGNNVSAYIILNSHSTFKKINNMQVENYNYSNIKPIDLVTPKPNKEITVKEITAAGGKSPITATIKPMRVEKLTNSATQYASNIKKVIPLPIDNSKQNYFRWLKHNIDNFVQLKDNQSNSNTRIIPTVSDASRSAIASVPKGKMQNNANVPGNTQVVNAKTFLLLSKLTQPVKNYTAQPANNSKIMNLNKLLLMKNQGLPKDLSLAQANTSNTDSNLQQPTNLQLNQPIQMNQPCQIMHQRILGDTAMNTLQKTMHPPAYGLQSTNPINIHPTNIAVTNNIRLPLKAYTAQQPSQQQTCIPIMKPSSYQTVQTKSVSNTYSSAPVLYLQGSQAMTSTSYTQVQIHQPLQVPQEQQQVLLQADNTANQTKKLRIKEPWEINKL